MRARACVRECVHVCYVIDWCVARIIIIMLEICKAPTVRPKALDKHYTHNIAYIEMENVIPNLTKANT